jgi:hypothetical protein
MSRQQGSQITLRHAEPRRDTSVDPLLDDAGHGDLDADELLDKVRHDTTLLEPTVSAELAPVAGHAPAAKPRDRGPSLAFARRSPTPLKASL